MAIHVRAAGSVVVVGIGGFVQALRVLSGRAYDDSGSFSREVMPTDALHERRQKTGEEKMM